MSRGGRRRFLTRGGRRPFLTRGDSRRFLARDDSRPTASSEGGRPPGTGRRPHVFRAVRRLVRDPAAVRFGVLLLMLGLLAPVALLAPRPDLADLPGLADRLGGYAPVAAIVGGALLLVALVPRTFITLASGALFGALEGAAYALGAALLAAAVGFAVGRLLGREFVAERVRGRLARLDGWFARQSVLGVVTVRLLPIAGFGLVSYGYGTTGARVLPFLVGSVVASAPTAFGYAAVGAAVTSPGEVNWFAAAPAGLGLIASAVLIARWWRTERERRHPT